MRDIFRESRAHVHRLFRIAEDALETQSLPPVPRLPSLSFSSSLLGLIQMRELAKRGQTTVSIRVRREERASVPSETVTDAFKEVKSEMLVP